MTNFATQPGNTAVRFLKDHEIFGIYVFPGAANYQGGFPANTIAAFPDTYAADLIARGIAEPAPPAPTPPSPPTVVKLFVRQHFTFAHCDYMEGDVGGFPQPLADQLVAAGKATVAS